jgi:hypothetical protein
VLRNGISGSTPDLPISVFALAVAFADAPHDAWRTSLLAPNGDREKVTGGLALDEGPVS